LKVGQDLFGWSYVFDLKDNIVGKYDNEESILYLREDYEYGYELFKRLLMTSIKFEVYVDTSGSRTLQDLQKIR
jgi:hypothetical protein